MSLYERLTGGADPADPFLHLAGGRLLTYGDVVERAARMAAVLRRAGAGPDTRVMVQVDKSPDAVALYLATLQTGAVYVPLNPAYTPAEVAFFVGDAEPVVFVADPGSRTVTPPTTTLLTLGVDGHGTLTDRLDGAVPMDGHAARSGDEVAAMLYTSGTTGRSKGALLTSDNLVSNADALYRAWGWRTDDVLVHTLPIFHTHGLFVALGLAMLGGSAVRFHERFDAARVLADLSDATVLMGVPTHYHRILADPELDETDLRHMRLFTSGSAPLSALVHAEFERRTGHRILERYGMTETGMLFSNPLDGERIAGTVGFALPGVEARVAGEHGAPAPPGQTGIVQVRGANVFSGYWRLPDAAEFTDDGFFHTGDIGTMDTAGRLTLAGRASDMIISGGLNVYPKEVELVLDGHPQVVESAVIGVPHPDFGEGVVAVLVADPGIDLDAVASLAGDSLAPFKRPKHYAVVESLPRNAMGKVQKAELRRAFRAVFSD